MPSFKESFGLVYAEALSQGLPVIYSINEGFDKNFEEGYVGYHTNPLSVTDIADKMELLINNFESIQKNCIKASRNYRWDEISKKILDLYQSI